MIKLKKDIWKKTTLSKCCEFHRGVTYSTKDEVDNDGVGILRANNINAESSQLNFDNLRLISKEAKVKENQKLRKNDVLICTASGSLDHIGKVAFAKEDTNYYAGGFMGIIRPLEKEIDPNLLFNIFLSERFTTFIQNQRAGTNIQNLKFSNIESFEISLPPLAEQRQIAALFQSIETAMVKVDGQEKIFKALWLRLIDEFVCDKPTFGNLLNGKKLQRVNYFEVTEKIMRRIVPESYGIEKIIGGEHLNSEDFKIRTWDTVGKDPLGPAFHVLFQAGDILYGSRRTYLKKVAFAEFEGVCANTTYVIRANEEYLLQDLLKHIMLSEKFTQYSIGVSKGSTNPYINWKDLDNFSFQIPDIETQKQIVKVLDSFIEIREQLKQQKNTLKNLKQKLLNEILG